MIPTGYGNARKKQRPPGFPMVFSYEESGDGFLATLNYQEQKISSFKKNDEGISGGVSGGVTGGVTGGVKELLEFIEKYPGKNARQIQEQLQIPQRTLERRLRELKSKGYIEFKGASKTGGYYRIA